LSFLGEGSVLPLPLLPTGLLQQLPYTSNVSEEEEELHCDHVSPLPSPPLLLLVLAGVVVVVGVLTTGLLPVLVLMFLVVVVWGVVGVLTT